MFWDGAWDNNDFFPLKTSFLHLKKRTGFLGDFFEPSIKSLPLCLVYIIIIISLRKRIIFYTRKLNWILQSLFIPLYLIPTNWPIWELLVKSSLFWNSLKNCIEWFITVCSIRKRLNLLSSSWNRLIYYFSLATCIG